LIDGRGWERRRLDELEAVRLESEFRNQPLGKNGSFPRPGVSFLMAAGPLGTGDDVNLVHAGLKRPQQVQTFYPSAAWQRKEADPGTELFFERTAVEILGGIKPLAEKKGMAQSVFFGIHNNPPPPKKNGDVVETSPSFLGTPLCQFGYFISRVPNGVKPNFSAFSLFTFGSGTKSRDGGGDGGALFEITRPFNI
jgi:hypothetical protein